MKAVARTTRTFRRRGPLPSRPIRDALRRPPGRAGIGPPGPGVGRCAARPM